MAVAKKRAAAGQVTDGLPTAAVNAGVKRDYAGRTTGAIR